MPAAFAISAFLLALLPGPARADTGSCPEPPPEDTGAIVSDRSCASVCDGCCAPDGTCLAGTSDDACGAGEVCVDCAAEGDVCDGGVCRSEGWTSFGYQDDDELDIGSVDDAVRVRDDLLTFIFGEPSLPTGGPTLVETDVADPLSPPVAGALRVDRLTFEMTDGFTSVAYLYTPEAPVNKLMVFHQGHGDAYADYGGDTAIGTFVARGWSVMAFCMPLYGECTGPMGSHGDMYNSTSFVGYSYLKFFLEPVALGLNYAEDSYSFDDVAMMGISGGGWTTTVYAALDPRVRVSVPVAGSIPIYLRSDPRDLGDAEQYGYEFYQISGYPDLYVLGSLGANRKQLQVLNRYDSCCFAGTTYQAYESDVAGRVADIGPGAFEVFLDQSHRDHKISSFALEASIVHTVEGDGVHLIDDLSPAYGAFAQAGSWAAVEDAFALAGAEQEAAAGDTTAWASWTLTGDPGLYRVSATWTSGGSLATDAAFTVSADEERVVPVDQSAAPSGLMDESARWTDLAGEIASTSGTLTVTLNGNATAAVRADGVRFERLCSLCSWYTDADGDGYGDASTAAYACTPRSDQVADGTDCDDADAATWPGAPEDTTSVDRDCDGDPGPTDTGAPLDTADTSGDTAADSDSDTGSGAGDSADPEEPKAEPATGSGCGCAQGGPALPPASRVLGALALMGVIWSSRRSAGAGRRGLPGRRGASTS